MPEPALETELDIDPDRFETVFSQVWGDNEDPDDRVHIDTEVEAEIIRVVDDWVDHVHESAGDGSTDGLFLVIEGAQATGKTTMTRFINNTLDAVENPDRRDIPMVIPIWDSTDPNPTPYKYRGMLNGEGRRLFESLDGIVPDIDEKIAALNSMSAELSDDHVQRLSSEWDVNPEQVRGILEDTQSGGDREPKEVLSDLAEEGYVFTFIFDEMVSSSDKERAQSVLKWFKDHLYPYVGLILFCHPNVSDAIRREMQDQARRRNFDATLEIAGDNHDIKEDIIIDIRGEQDRIIDLERLLQRYFSEVSLNGVDEYGPFNEGNVAWMRSLLQAGGLIGNLIDGVKPAVKKYARALADGDDEKGIGVYLFDECSRMEHIRLRQRLEAHTNLDPREDNRVVWRAKELITQSIDIDELEPEEVEALEDNRVLYEETDSGELKITPSLVDYGQVIQETGPRPRPEPPEQSLLAVYEDALREYSDQKTDPDEREELRRNVEMGISTLVGHLNSRQVNIAKTGGVALPGQSSPQTEYMELSSARTEGRANKLQISDGDYADYGYSFLTYVLFDDESLSSPDVQETIIELYDGDNGIILLTDKSEEEVTEPDWFGEEIDRQRWNDPAFEWGDIVEIVHLDRLSEVLAVYQHINDQGLEDDSSVLEEIDRLDSAPTTPALYDLLDGMYDDISSSLQSIHNQIYAKYQGPTLPEAEAFTEILDEVREQGFISQHEVDKHREEFGNEIDSLMEKEAIITVDGDGLDTVVFLQKDFGSASKLAGQNVNGADDLPPVPPAVFEELEELREMEEDRIEYGDDDIEDALSELEDKKEWIDYFLFEADVVADIKDAIDDTDVDVFTAVVNAINAARSTEQEDYNTVCNSLNADRDLWNQISDLEVDTDISPIHRALFYARLHREPPPWAEDYLEPEEEYPELLYELYSDIEDILEALDQAEEDVEDRFSGRSDDYSDLSLDLADFMEIEYGNDAVDLSNDDMDRLQDKELDDLREMSFETRITAIAGNAKKERNLSRATRLLSDAQSAVNDDLEDGLDADSISDIDLAVAEEYLHVGKAIVRRLIEDEIVFKDSDQPNVVVGELEQFCENLKSLTRKAEEKQLLEGKLEEEWEEIENIPGDSLEEKEESLREAKRMLKLKDGHCELCQTEWENLTEDRQEEITEEINGLEDEYDVSLSLDVVDDIIESVQDDQETVDDAESQISSIKTRLDGIDLEEYREKLSDLKEKYDTED